MFYYFTPMNCPPLWVFSAKPTTSGASFSWKNFTQNGTQKIVNNDEKIPPPANRWGKGESFTMGQALHSVDQRLSGGAGEGPGEDAADGQDGQIDDQAGGPGEGDRHQDLPEIVDDGTEHPRHPDLLSGEDAAQETHGKPA